MQGPFRRGRHVELQPQKSWIILFSLLDEERGVSQESPRRLPGVSQVFPRRLPGVSQQSSKGFPVVSQESPSAVGAPTGERKDGGGRRRGAPTAHCGKNAPLLAKSFTFDSEVQPSHTYGMSIAPLSSRLLTVPQNLHPSLLKRQF